MMTTASTLLDQLLPKAKAAADHFGHTAAVYDRSGEFPFANFDRLHEEDLLRLTATTANGGHGGGLREAQAIVAEIARGEPSTALVLAMHYSHHAALSRNGRWPLHLVERVSKANVAGVALLNSAQVEPRIGSPSHGALPETTAVRDGKVWRITGHKTYATGIPLLKWVSVLAVTDDPEPRLASFLVPRDAPGVHIVETWNATGMRGTASHDLILDRVAVPLEDIIDPQPASGGLKRDELGGAWYFTLIGSVYHGLARSARDWLVDFVSHHAPASLGAPLSTLPRIQDELGEIEVKLATSERLLRSVAEDADAGRPLGPHAGIAKHVATENAIAVTTIALDLGGNIGLSRENPLERHHRDALCGKAHAPQNNMIRVIAAKAALASATAPAASGTSLAPAAQKPPRLSIVASGV
jgi:alkylation response protein AidB-like acyl-CoA dehydrogenase